MKAVKIDYSKRFEKDLRKVPLKTQIAFRNRLEVFLTDKFNPILRNHPLTGKYQGYRSINVTGDWRAIYREMDNGKTIYFDLLGTHGKLYK